MWSIADFPDFAEQMELPGQLTDHACICPSWLPFQSSSLSPCGCHSSKEKSVLLGVLESNLQNIERLDEKWLLYQEVLSPPLRHSN